ncbi:hypothetical protein A4X06_0g6961 [Tilletia controversa]|uniref:Palmitoyl-protein thioesterase 1 n=1 Tax=Tilletia controversa TaxID=13291 RepID=A0A8X7MP28_9BASI|nr:hypothetical protein CF328_g5990 [Tilletia controversa]KAE8242373.1 hypothetical protein A4X06_0g6961 [Tilletia controversa]
MAALFLLLLTATCLSLLTLFSLPPSSLPLPLHNAPEKAYHPVVLWHGLGDSAYSEPMHQVQGLLEELFPGIYVHLVHLADDLGSDQRAGLFGEVNEQVEKVCEQLAGIPELEDGFDAIGFSQGGQFLRAYVQRCNAPPVRNLVTFGSQHMGVADLPACKPLDLLCRLAESAMRAGVYTNYAQKHIVAAQYVRNPLNKAAFHDYLTKNAFLADINNERRIDRNYVKRLGSLEKFVMIMFSQDLTVSPKESSLFASYADPNTTTTYGLASRIHPRGLILADAPLDEIIPLRKSVIYTEDRLGLQKMDKKGSLVFETCEGIHMQIDQECEDKVFGKYIGIAPPSSLALSLSRSLSRVSRPIRDLGSALWYQAFGVRA